LGFYLGLVILADTVSGLPILHDGENIMMVLFFNFPIAAAVTLAAAARTSLKE
jgi:hypothetical protein